MDKLHFKEQILNYYLDGDGQVTVDKNPTKWSTGNGLLHTGLFYMILAINQILDDADKLRFRKAVDDCWVRAKSGHVIPGLLNRNPGRPDLEGQDDYVGVCGGSYCVRDDSASNIVIYG